MPIRAHCPSCQTEYTLVDSLRGKFVRCERCRRPFRAEPPRLDHADETPAAPVIPPMQLTPTATGHVPLTIVATGEPGPVETPAPPRRQRQSSSGGAGKAGFPIGIIFIIFLVIRGVMSLSSSSSRTDPPRWQPPSNPALPKGMENLQFRLVKDRGIVVIPKEGNDGKKLPDNQFPIRFDKEKGMVIEPQKK